MTNYFRGYATSRPFGDFIMPVPAQNSCMREFVLRKSGLYIPPQLEHKFENCFMQLFGTIAASSPGDTIVMYSYDIIKKNLPKLHLSINNFINNDVKLAFVLENVIFDNNSEFDNFVFSQRLSSLIMDEKKLLKIINRN